MTFDDPTPPTARDRRIFAVLWLFFWMGIGLLAPRAGSGFLVGAAVTGLCLIASLLLNREAPRRAHLLGLAVPAGLLILGLGSKWFGPSVLAGTSTRLFARLPFLGVGLVGMITTLVSATLGNALRQAWMDAFVPVAWSISHALLALVFYGVVTPTGLLMRLAGRDPMHRAIDRSANSYWTKREQVADPARYFGQS